METDVVICDDHPIFRNGVIATISQRPEFRVVAEASDGSSCVAKLEIFKPQILVCDLSMPVLDGFQVLEWARSHQPELRVFILSMHTDLPIVQKAKDLGANGFLAKEDAQAELLAAIDGGRNNFYTSESIGSKTATKIMTMDDSDVTTRLRNVSPAERKVLVLLTKSHTNKDIAKTLNLSVRTVEAHRASLASKLDTRGPNKLIDFAVRYRNYILSD